MVMRMDALFLVDRDARQKAMSSAERLAQRNELARPWVDEIRDVCRSLAKVALPKSALGKAVNYTLNQWPKLVRCLELPSTEMADIAAVLVPTFVYIEDNLGRRAEKLLLCGFGAATSEAQSTA